MHKLVSVTRVGKMWREIKADTSVAKGTKREHINLQREIKAGALFAKGNKSRLQQLQREIKADTSIAKGNKSRLFIICKGK